MTWVKIDDRFDEHPKVVGAGPLGLALQVRAICYCARNLTDGFVSDAIVKRLVADLEPHPETMADLMVQAGLWERRDGGFSVHDYLDYNPAKAAVLAERSALTAARSAAGRAGGFASGQSRRSKQGSKNEANAKQNGSPVPDPVPDPDPLPKTRSPRARATVAPDGAPALAGEFAQFWNDYPRHIATEKAERAFRAALKRGATLAQMLAAIGRQKAEREALALAGEFCPEWPYPASWLNAGRWKDESLNATSAKPAWEPPETRAARGDRSGLAVLFTPPKGGES